MLMMLLLFRIAMNAAVNKMHAVNLAIVFGMGLAPESSTPLGVSPDLGLYQTMVKIWITNASIIFPEVDDDEDVEQESVYIEGTESIENRSSEGPTPTPPYADDSTPVILEGDFDDNRDSNQPEQVQETAEVVAF